MLADDLSCEINYYKVLMSKRLNSISFIHLVWSVWWNPFLVGKLVVGCFTDTGTWVGVLLVSVVTHEVRLTADVKHVVVGIL